LIEDIARNGMIHAIYIFIRNLASWVNQNNKTHHNDNVDMLHQSSIYNMT